MDSEAIDIDVQPDGAGRLLVRWRIDKQGAVDIAVGPTPAINHLARVHSVVELGPVGAGPRAELNAAHHTLPKRASSWQRPTKKTAWALVK